MANLIVSAVPQSDVGIATGINTIMRTAGGAFGSAAVTAILTGSATGVDGLPTEGGYTAAFVASVVVGLLAVLAATFVPRPSAKPVGVPAAGRRRVVAPRPQAQLQARPAGRAQLAVHRLGQPARDRQPETRPGAALRVGATDPAVEEPLAARVRQTGALVLDARRPRRSPSRRERDA